MPQPVTGVGARLRLLVCCEKEKAAGADLPVRLFPLQTETLQTEMRQTETRRVLLLLLGAGRLTATLLRRLWGTWCRAVYRCRGAQPCC